MGKVHTNGSMDKNILGDGNLGKGMEKENGNQKGVRSILDNGRQAKHQASASCKLKETGSTKDNF